MNIVYYFFYNEQWDRHIPRAKSEDNTKESRILSNYLSEIYLDFSKNILSKLETFNQEFDCSSQSWGVIVFNDYVDIYFLSDEDNSDYQATINRDVFKKAILAWDKFIQTPPFVGEIIINLP